jgi:uncharacterized damage-inducible protein DinB
MTTGGGIMLSLFREMAHYNAWMNKNLYAHLGDVPDERRKANVQLFFGSIHGTLNHLLLVDRLWLARLQGESYPIESLDQELYADFAQLRLQRKKTDRKLAEHIEALTEADLDNAVSYTSASSGQQRSFPTPTVLMHLFNHQTHHRGQITAAMSQFGVDYGVTDLIFMPDENHIHG